MAAPFLPCSITIIFIDTTFWPTLYKSMETTCVWLIPKLHEYNLQTCTCPYHAHMHSNHAHFMHLCAPLHACTKYCVHTHTMHTSTPSMLLHIHIYMPPTHTYQYTAWTQMPYTCTLYTVLHIKHLPTCIHSRMHTSSTTNTPNSPYTTHTHTLSLSSLFSLLSLSHTHMLVQYIQTSFALAYTYITLQKHDIIHCA